MPYTQQHVVSQGETPASSSYFNAEMTYIYNAINAEAANIAAHVADTEDAHDASAISVLDTAENFTGTNVEAVLAEVQADLDGRFSTETGHDHDGTDSAKIPESSLNLTDVTTGNVSTSAHGFVPKAPNDTAKFLRGDGAWGVPSVFGVQVSDATEYSHTGDTNYSLEKTFTFSTPVASMASFAIQLTTKMSSGNGYYKFDLDDTTIIEASFSVTIYTVINKAFIGGLPAGEHTLKCYIKTTNATYTAFMKDIRATALCVPTA
jgi:hypothetical protein